jgi:hypothetical protein
VNVVRDVQLYTALLNGHDSSTSILTRGSSTIVWPRFFGTYSSYSIKPRHLLSIPTCKSVPSFQLFSTSSSSIFTQHYLIPSTSPIRLETRLRLHLIPFCNGETSAFQAQLTCVSVRNSVVSASGQGHRRGLRAKPWLRPFLAVSYPLPKDLLAPVEVSLLC